MSDPVVSEANNTSTSESSRIRAGRGKFVVMAGAYALGAFNDNFLKQAALLMAVQTGEDQKQAIVSAVFTAPFLLFAAYAGWLSDKYSKRTVIVGAKFLEVVAMVAGGAGIYYACWPLIFLMLFIMGTQATIFGPALNGAIPELYPADYVTKANAGLKVVVTMAILAGIAGAGVALNHKSMMQPEQKLKVYVEDQAGKNPGQTTLLGTADQLTIRAWTEKPDESDAAKAKAKETGKPQFIILDEVALTLKRSAESKTTFEGQLATAKGTVVPGDQILQVGDEKVNFGFTDASGLEAKDLETLKVKAEQPITLGHLIIAICVVGIALAGFLISLFVPKFTPANTKDAFPWAGPFETVKVLWASRTDSLLFVAIIGDGIFWMIAVLQVLIINPLGLKQLGLSESGTSYLLLTQMLGVAVGGILAGVLSKGERWFNVLVPGMLGMFFGMVAMALVPQAPKEHQATFVFILLGIIGASGGLFMVPLESFIQIRPAPDQKGKVIASANFAAFAGMLLASALYAGISLVGQPTTGFAVAGLIALLTSVWLIFVLPKKAKPAASA